MKAKCKQKKAVHAVSVRLPEDVYERVVATHAALAARQVGRLTVTGLVLSLVKIGLQAVESAR